MTKSSSASPVAAVRVGGPVAPSVGLLDRGPVVGLGDLAVLLEAVEGLEEEQPGELGDPVEVAVEAGVLAHGVAGAT